MDRMRVLVAPDKYKGCLTATEVSDAMARGVRLALPEAEVTLIPIADGGDGFLDAILVGLPNATVQVADVLDAMGRGREARFVLDHKTAYVEAAEAISVTHHEPSPQVAARADSRGVGQLVSAALDAGAERIVVGLGGTATTDAGAGLLQALGVLCLDEHGRPVSPGGGSLRDIARVETIDLDRRLQHVELVAALDVSNPLLGPRGAVDVFAPQKGADADGLAALNDGFRHWHQFWLAQADRDLDIPGGGAAGGLGAALVGVLDAKPISGADLVLDLGGVLQAMPGHDLVLTGEGSLDEQSLTGKGPHAVIDAARRSGTAVAVIAGRCTLTDEQVDALNLAGIRSLAEVYSNPFDDPDAKVEAQTEALVSFWATDTGSG